MNAQQEVVAYWKFCEERGLQVSVRSCIVHCRASGVRISERNAYTWLAAFSAQRPHRQNRRQHRASTKTAQPVLTPAPRQHLARKKEVSLVSKPEVVVNSSEFTPPSPPKRRVASAEDLRAWQILRTAWEALQACGVRVPLRRREWEQRNKRHALGLEGEDAGEQLAVRIRLANTNGHATWVRGAHSLGQYIAAWSELDPAAESRPKLRLEPGQTVHYTSWGQPVIGNADDPEAIDAL